MGFLYIKVIESKKVAVRSSFFVNYPFIRLKIGKQKKDTNFKPGVEWWDKIYNFRDVNVDDNLVLVAQARDKSIHVFGSDWLGEASIKLKDLMDGRVHQQWFKLGQGRKQHSRSPRGYLHLAFHYFHEAPGGQRPFSSAPIEPVITFEEWLAKQSRNWVADSSSFSHSSVSSINNEETEAQRLRKSAPASYDRTNSISPDADRKAPLASRPKSKSTNQLVKPQSSRQRASSIPADIRSPQRERKPSTKRVHYKDESSDESGSDSDAPDQGVRTADLIDLSIFESPSMKRNTGQSREPFDLFNRESPVKYSPKANHTSLRSSAPTSAATTDDVLSKMMHNEAFEDWYHPKDAKVVSYNPQNPFLSVHESHAPAFSVKN